MVKYNLPVEYDKLKRWEKKDVRDQYIEEQKGKCWHCGCSLEENPPEKITRKPINWKLFPKNFLKHPVHLQHDHFTGLTEGAVHSYCNAVLWQYYGK